MNVPTIILLLSIGSYVFGLLLIIFQFREKDFPQIPFWIAAKFLQGTGSLLLYFDNPFSGIILSFGCAYEAWAILFITDRAVSRKVHLSAALMIIIVSILTIPLNPAPAAAVKFLMLSVFYGIPAYFLLSSRSVSFLLRSFLGLSYLFLALLYISHSLQLILGLDHFLLISGKAFFQTLPVATFCMVLISGFSMLLLAIEKNNSELHKSKAEIQKKNQELIDLNASKDRFFSIIAHDLKAPFQGLIGYSQMLSADYDTLPDEERLELSKGINDLSLNTYKLLGNLLEWSRLQTGMITFAPVKIPLDKEISSIVSLFRHTARNKNITLEYSTDKSFCVIADRNMLATIVRNLISNSIKFTGNGGIVSLKTRDAGDYIEIAVSDTGVGIEPDKIENLFKIGQKISTRGTANEEGTGLGLLLCKEMAEKQNGTIRAESQPGKGTTFYFTLPKSL